MPSLKTYHDGKNIYSVDMMIAYVNERNHPTIKLPVQDLLPQLEQDVWGEWSPMTVLQKMEVKKYKENAKRIQDAELKYPIFVTNNRTIIDGYHRVAKAVLEHKQTIQAYVFEASLMKKFILDSKMDFVRVHQELQVSDILELWSKRFCE
jgi:hypothetical protein